MKRMADHSDFAVENDASTSSKDNINSEFWNELCGSSLARALGVKDASVESLSKFDNWYFGFYPYLLPFVDLGACKGKRTLEIGLGYGSLSQELANAGAIYTGLDIAAGPVTMVNHRLAQKGLAGRAVQGSVLDCPFPDQSFDCAVAIGSLHHTGDIACALSELHRCLVPNGQLIFMVYNALSYRRWLRWPVSTGRHALWVKGLVSRKPKSGESERLAYDADAEGNAAPETDFLSTSELHIIMADWSIETMQLKNIGDEGPLRFLPRSLKLKAFGGWTGLDIYVRATRR